MLTPEEAIRYIEAMPGSAKRCDTGTTRRLLALLGDPQKKLHFVHVAGSNGKGSTCTMLASVLRAAGYKTGLFTSPYIYEFGERIQIDGCPIPGEKLAALTERVRALAEGLAEAPSLFELVTALALAYFAAERCDIVVLEVGLGGRRDATNAIDAPELGVICNIGLEHTELLGDTLEKIAEEKAGILKSGCDCVCYDGAGEVSALIERVCAERGIPFHPADFSKLEAIAANIMGQRFSYRGEEYTLSLLGPCQLRNASVVIEAAKVLSGRGFPISDEALRRGLSAASWPVRLEPISREPLVIADGGHNPQCMEALREGLESVLPGQKVVFLTCVLRDKDYAAMMRTLLPIAESFVCLTAESPRALPGEELCAFLRENGASASYAGTMEEGLAAALREANGAPVVICGSLYMMKAGRAVLPGACKKALRDAKKAARRALPARERMEKSRSLCEAILMSEAYRRAEYIMSYFAVNGEADLTLLHDRAENDGKKLVYPVSFGEGRMEAYHPLGSRSFRRGAFDIPEPDPERSERVEPERIDLVLCPCTAFDGRGGRLGMGGGYYDRFLPRCPRARIAAVAFDCQKVDAVPEEAWDGRMHAVFTESGENIFA